MKRREDVRVKIIKRVFGDDQCRSLWINPGRVLDGYLDSKGNFCFDEKNFIRSFKETKPHGDTIIPKGFFKILGKFYFRKAR